MISSPSPYICTIETPTRFRSSWRRSYMDTNPTLYFEIARGGDPVGLAQLLVSTPSVNPMLGSGGRG